MDNQTKRPPKSRIRRRSSRGSFENASEENMTKAMTEEGKSQSDRILTRHRRRVSGLGRDDAEFARLEFPKGSQRRRFPKVKRLVNDGHPSKTDEASDGTSNTTLSSRLQSPEDVSKDYLKHIKTMKRKRNEIFLKKAPGKRRRRRRPLITPSEIKVAADCAKPEDTFIQDDEIPLKSAVNSLHCDPIESECKTEDDLIRTQQKLSAYEEEASDEFHRGKFKKPNERTSSVGDNSEVEEINVQESGQNDDDKPLLSVRSGDFIHDRNDGVDISMKSSPHMDDNSCSAVTSHDGDSIYSSECGSLKDRLSHNATDSDGGSITTNDSRQLSPKHKHELGHHKTAIDFRIGGRLEARDYLNMWYPSKIIQVDWEDKEVLIHFERWNSRFDEWVPMDSPRLRAIKRTSARKEKKEKERAHLMLKEYKVGEIVHAKWTDCKMYPAKIIKMNPNSTCNVMFYDGYERVVQSINIRKLPPELNFKTAPPPELPEKCRRSSGSKSEDTQTPQVKSESPEISSCTPKLKVKHAASTKGNVVGLQTKRRKLLVGGIFQAKRHQMAAKPESTPKSDSHNAFTAQEQSPSEPTVDKTDHIPPANLNVDVSDMIVDGEAGNVQDIPVLKSPDSHSSLQLLGEESIEGGLEDGAKRKRYSGSVARKEFIIEEDHNHYKCLVDGCGKAFRKDALLASHMKHYHRDLAKADSTPKKMAEEGQQCVDSKEFEKEKPQEPIKEQVMIPVKKEGNVERKLITEKRRQLLLQRKLERRHQQAAMALKAKLAKKSSVISLEKDEENVEGSGPRPEKMKPPTRKKKFVFTSRGVIKKLKKKKLEEVERLKHASSQDLNGGVVKSSTEITEFPTKSIPLTPVSDENLNVRVILKGKRKRRPEHIISSDDSDKSASAPNSDSAESIDDKRTTTTTTTTKVGKRYSAVSRSGIKLKSSNFSWRDSEREEVVNCRCQRQEEDGLMMQCEICLAWQHGTCFDIEDEDKVPEKYICFACENPKGLRQSFKYKHNQDWFKTGDLATFKFLPKNDNWKSKQNILRTHNLVTQILAINNVLHSLDYKLHIARVSKHPNLVLWSKPWSNAATGADNVSDSKLDKDSVKESSSSFDSGGGAAAGSGHSHVGTWAFSDHSYSVPTRIYHDSHFVGHAADAFITTDHGDDKDVCLEVAANEVLDVQGTGPPAQDCILDYCLDAKPDVCDDNCDIKDSGECVSSDDLDSKVPCRNQSPKNKDRSPTSLPPSSSSCNDKTRSLVVDGDVIKSHNLTNVAPEEVDEATCKANLLYHIELLQEELDHRLDELDQQLESLESHYEFPSLTGAVDSCSSVPRFKRLLKAMIKDLMKVRRMTLYS